MDHNSKKSSWEPILIGASAANEEEIREYIQKGMIDMPLDKLLHSHVHMCMNRLMRSAQRAHEMVVYYLLTQSYKSLIAQEKYRNKSKVTQD